MSKPNCYCCEKVNALDKRQYEFSQLLYELAASFFANEYIEFNTTHPICITIDNSSFIEPVYSFFKSKLALLKEEQRKIQLYKEVEEGKALYRKESKKDG